MLALTGAAGGVLLAYWGVDMLRAALPANLPRVWLIAVDLRVIAIAARCGSDRCAVRPGASAPDVTADGRRRCAAAARGHGGRGAAGGAHAFLVSEVALAAVLLVGAGIFASSFIRLVNTDMGFRSEL